MIIYIVYNAKCKHRLFFITYFLFLFFNVSCRNFKTIQTSERSSFITGTEFYKTAFPFKWQQRDSFVVKEILSGNIPSFLKKFVRIDVRMTDSSTGKKIKAT